MSNSDARAQEYAEANGGELIDIQASASDDHICVVDVEVLSEREANSGNAGGGPGWAHSAGIPGRDAVAFHLPELEEGLDADLISDVVLGDPEVLDSGLGGDHGSGGARLLDMDA